MSDDFNLDDFRINEKLVAIHLDATTRDEVIHRLADILIEQGYIKPSYIEAAIEREATCPTGLPTRGVGTAIPHAGLEHTLKAGIAVGTLVQPVKFGALGDPDSEIDISVVFMLSVTQPDAQVYLLQSLIDVYKDEDLLRRLAATTDPAVVVGEVNAALAKVKASGGNA